jgi:hypothetical protein
MIRQGRFRKFVADYDKLGSHAAALARAEIITGGAAPRRSGQFAGADSDH